ncbi:hypothetical protein H310_11880 [Aphanomyces invadans]|uniref:Uncharacterized protein n=1 Tax=Aphanomyces invadans TaxID=157072 RepID=A0A024TKP7_9STRA|nr:hypothetical protein H310_11880 [Aphanomyces invadans]ETV94618.1 hypothetical protein H310_11880 [Aphanomyces invadans]|eukprot:XP_008876933.1 hypothetical protein H310_11880 [Aphanomyces invadans]
MGDDGMSASELRSRYGRGGSVRDCDLSAAQLRSRYAIEKNTFKDHPTDNSALIAAAVVALLIIAGAAFYFTHG